MKLLALYTDQKEIQFKNLSTSFSEIFDEEKHYISHAKKFFHNVVCPIALLNEDYMKLKSHSKT